MQLSSLPVYITHPFPLQVLIDATRSVREGCYLHILQERITLRTRLSEAQNHRCCWCRRRMDDAINNRKSPTLEHIVPKSMGGSNHPDNLAVACRRCNEKRGTQDIEAFLAHIAKVGWAV